PARAGADDRSRHGRRPAPRRGLSRGGGGGARARPRVADGRALSKLLVRNLAQVASPVGAGPLRGERLREVKLLEDAFVLCDGDRIAAIGRMRHLGRIPGEVEEVDGSGLCAVPGLVDCHTHPAFGGDRVEEFSLRAGGASYEELHAAGGGILSTVRATRAAGEDGLRVAVECHAEWMLRHGTTTW